MWVRFPPEVQSLIFKKNAYFTACFYLIDYICIQPLIYIVITLSIIAQILVAITILIIWVFRFYNVEKEFRSYGLSDLTRNIVGASKIILSTLLIAGIWYKDLLFVSSLLMASLMLAAQYYHFKAKHPWLYFILSFLLLLLCLFIAAVSNKYI